MFKSIIETKRLFKIEGLANGKIDIKATDYLLSLADDEQATVLNNQLVNLKRDLGRIERKETESVSNQNPAVEKAQLQLLIQVIEGLLARV